MALRGLKPLVMAAVAALTLSGCMTDGGYGFRGGRGYVDPFYGPGVAPFGGGWYNDFYYPGTGVFVYDRRGTRRGWSTAERRYWQGQRALQRRGAPRAYRGTARPDPRAYRNEGRAIRQSRQAERRVFRQQQRANRAPGPARGPRQQGPRRGGGPRR